MIGPETLNRLNGEIYLLLKVQHLAKCLMAHDTISELLTSINLDY